MNLSDNERTSDIDDLAAFFDAVRQNQSANFGKYPDHVERLSTIDRVFRMVATNWTDAPDILSATLFARSHGAFRAATGAAMAGQMFETSGLVRSCIEQAGYAALMTHKPEIAEVWEARNDDEASLRATRNAFKQTNVREAISLLDPTASAAYQTLYDDCIDWGAHPNIRGVAANMILEKTGPATRKLRIVHLHSDGPQVVWALCAAARGGQCALRIFELVMPTRFREVGIQRINDPA